MHFDATKSESQAAKPKNLKVNNRKSVLDLLRRYGEMSATELSDMSKLSRTTVMKSLVHFLQSDVITSEGKGDSTNEGGKKPELYAFNSKLGYICTLSIRADKISCGITDLGARLINRLKMPHSPNEKLSLITENMSILVMATIDTCGITVKDLKGIIVCIDGVVDCFSGTVHHATYFPCWGKDVQLAELVRISLGKNVPIIVESSVHMLGFAELRETPTLILKNVVTFYSDLGIGACIMKNGHIVYGKHAFLGELGHMVISPTGTESCYCGNKGCCEMIISEPRILIKARREHQGWPESKLYEKAKIDELEFVDIFLAADAGDSFAKYLVDFIVRHFAIVLHNTIISHDPDIIILQGCYSNAKTYFLSKLRETVKSMQLAGFLETAHIRYSSIDLSKAYLTGPAYYMIEQLFANEKLYEM